MGLEDVRAKLRDRQEKAGARGTIDAYVCLDVELIDQLEKLQEDLKLEQQLDAELQPAKRNGKQRLGSASVDPTPKPSADLMRIEKEIEAKEREIRESSLRLVFRSIASDHYNRLLNERPADASPDANNDFLNALCEACLYKAFQRQADGSEEELEVATDKTDGLRWAEIHPTMSFGEWDYVTLQVVSLNQRVVDVPFSLR